MNPNVDNSESTTDPAISRFSYPPCYKDKVSFADLPWIDDELRRMEREMRSTGTRMAILFRHSVDLHFRDALLRECGSMPRPETLAKKGHIVIDADGTWRLFWICKDGQKREIAAVSYLRPFQPQPPIFS